MADAAATDGSMMKSDNSPQKKMKTHENGEVATADQHDISLQPNAANIEATAGDDSINTRADVPGTPAQRAPHSAQGQMGYPSMMPGQYPGMVPQQYSAYPAYPAQGQQYQLQQQQQRQQQQQQQQPQQHQGQTVHQNPSQLTPTGSQPLGQSGQQSQQIQPSQSMDQQQQQQQGDEGNQQSQHGTPTNRPPQGMFPPGIPGMMPMMPYGAHPGMFYGQFPMMNPFMAQAFQKGNQMNAAYMPAPAPRSAGISLSLSCDEEQLSEYQMLVRKQLEIFEAQPEDVESNTQGRKKQVALGQVGIRCRHCAGFPLRQRGRGAVYYPAKLHGVYQAAQNMASSHLCESCQCIPPPLKAELRNLRDRRDTASGGKQ